MSGGKDLSSPRRCCQCCICASYGCYAFNRQLCPEPYASVQDHRVHQHATSCHAEPDDTPHSCGTGTGRVHAGGGGAASGCQAVQAGSGGQERAARGYKQRRGGIAIVTTKGMCDNAVSLWTDPRLPESLMEQVHLPFPLAVHAALSWRTARNTGRSAATVWPGGLTPATMVGWLSTGVSGGAASNRTRERSIRQCCRAPDGCKSKTAAGVPKEYAAAWQSQHFEGLSAGAAAVATAC